MDLSMERDCSALGSLFQQIINDMKNSSPLWEDFLAKAGKLHTCLRAAIQAIAAYLDAFQKIADAATNSRGASKEIGTALTRVCLRHKAVETRLKTFTTAIMDCLVQPLQEKLEDWKRSVATIDKEHAKEYKRCRTELKKRSNDTLRLQKKARKGQTDTIQTLMDSHMQDVTLRRAELEDVEKKSLRIAMIEERMRYCTFVDMLQPVVREECEVMSELGHLQEAMESIALVTKDPSILPSASEELIHDAKASICLYPESPGGSQCGSGNGGNNIAGPGSNSLGSRKSSVCSISSINSSGSSNSPGHHYQRSLSQFVSPALRLKPGESSDSGFCSSPALTIQAPSTTSQTHAVSTWPPHSQEVETLPPAADRPHTISSTYEKGHQRPPLTVYTFQNPETIYEANNGSASGSNGNCASPAEQNNSASSKSTSNSRPPLPVRCSSLERPLSANSNNRSGANLMQRQCPSPIPAHITKELSAQFAQQHHYQQNQQQQQLQQQLSNPPTYANISDLANMAAAKNASNSQQQQSQRQNSLQQQQSIDSISSQLSNDSNASASITTQQLQNNILNKTRSHSISSSVSSNTASLHSHPSIESTMATASLMGQTPSSGSSTPQNHYSPLLTNSPSSTAAGTPSGASITSSSGPTGIGNFVYNVDSPTPPLSSTTNQQTDSGSLGSGKDILKITENSTNITNNTPTNNDNINKSFNDSSSEPNNTTNSIVDTDSPTIIENDERSRASVLQKASMFEKQAAAAASALPNSSTSSIIPRPIVDTGIYGTRSTTNNLNQTSTPQPQQQQHMDQSEMDKCFEDSIQELNNLIGELDLFQQEIDASKHQKEQLAQQEQKNQQGMKLDFNKSNDDERHNLNGSNPVNLERIGSIADADNPVQLSSNNSLLEPKQKQYCSSSIQTNSSGCGTDISDTNSDDIVADDNQSNCNNNTDDQIGSCSNNLKLYGTGGGSSNYNSDSELSRCYVSETSSLAGGIGGNGGYENPTFAHFASTSSTGATAATSVTSSGFGISNFDDSFADNRSLLACSDNISHNSDTLAMPRHAYVDSDNGSGVVVIYDHQIPITPDIDYVKQNSEIVVLRTKSPQQLQLHEMRELQELPNNLCGTPESPETPTVVKQPTATVAPAKQRLSSFRASSEQQLQLLGSSGNNNNNHHHHHSSSAHRSSNSTFLKPDKGTMNSNSISAIFTTPKASISPSINQKTKVSNESSLKPIPPMIPIIPSISTDSDILSAQNNDTIMRRKLLPPKPNLTIFQQNMKNLEINNNVNNQNKIIQQPQQQQQQKQQQQDKLNRDKSVQQIPIKPLLNNKKIDFKTDLDAKIQQQKLKLLQKQKHQQQEAEAEQSQKEQKQDHAEHLEHLEHPQQSQQSSSVNHSSCSNKSSNEIQQNNHLQTPESPKPLSSPPSNCNININTEILNSSSTLISSSSSSLSVSPLSSHKTPTKYLKSSASETLSSLLTSSSPGSICQFHNQSDTTNLNHKKYNNLETTHPRKNSISKSFSSSFLSSSSSSATLRPLLNPNHSITSKTNSSSPLMTSINAMPAAVSHYKQMPVPMSSTMSASNNLNTSPIKSNIDVSKHSNPNLTSSANNISQPTTVSPSNSNTACPVTTPKPSITPRPASLSGSTRIARRSSVNAAKPPPPVRRSSSVTPSHNSTAGQSQVDTKTCTNNLSQQNSLNNSTESLPPPPAFLLDGRQTTGSMPGSPPSMMPASSLKVAETVKALSGLRHQPASPSALRRLQQQNQQQLQHATIQSSKNDELYCTTYKTDNDNLMHDEPTDYDAYYNTYIEVNTAATVSNAFSNYTFNSNQITNIYNNKNEMISSNFQKHNHQHQEQQIYAFNNSSNSTQILTIQKSLDIEPIPPPLPPLNPQQQQRIHNQKSQEMKYHQNPLHQNHHHNKPNQQQEIVNQNQYQHHQQLYQQLQQMQIEDEEVLLRQKAYDRHQHMDSLANHNNAETIYGCKNNASFRTSSPGIYAQPKVVTNMSSFRTTSPGPNGHHQLHHSHQLSSSSSTAPKTNPNLIAQLNARLNSKQQQQHHQHQHHQQQNYNDNMYGTSPSNHHHSHQNQQQINEAAYMRNSSAPQQSQHQYPSSFQQQQNNDDYGTSTNIDKTGSIRAKTKAEFLENLNAKLAKQSMSGRAFAVRNLINSKALPDPRVCHESLMDQIKRGATLKRNQKINDRSAPKIY